ncbi:tetratricopeptide repeat protein [Planctomicrobium sp. SH668]|uniref:tetratricopeptide repeat protein n=1 Tax=Planctomicrobium sp. SH668 TaxID=3448126 RepID=UPI003F5B9B4D
MNIFHFYKRCGLLATSLATMLMVAPVSADPPSGKGRGGGESQSRSSGPRTSGGGGRPSSGPPATRPSGGGSRGAPGQSRHAPNVRLPQPTQSKPTLGGASRDVSRPSAPVQSGNNRPTITRPEGGRPIGGAPSGRPVAERPGTGGDRPIRLPDGVGSGSSRPQVGTDRSRPPQTGSGNRPTIGGANRPVTRPDLGNLPSTGARPDGDGRPGNVVGRPGGPDGRPGDGRPGNVGGRPDGDGRPGNVVGRPGGPDGRPGDGRPGNVGGRPDGDGRPGNVVGRPGGPDGRPGDGRPNWNGGRPVIGGPSTRPDRPIVVGGGRPGGHDHDRDHNHFVGRPNYGRPGPGWGWNGGYNNYHNHRHYVNPRYGWYHGSWSGYGRNNWYRPFFWGTVTGWGLSSFAHSNWGYGYGSYYNPYYPGLGGGYATVYNYAQPVVIHNHVMVDDGNGGYVWGPEQNTTQTASVQAFDQGLAAFKAGDYQQSLQFLDTALQQDPNDPVIHEVRALALFANGAYQPAAAALNSLLSTSPGMDWTTMSSLYGNLNDYTTQLRALEAHCRANQQDAASFFLISYHYMVTGSRKEAIGTLKVVVREQPQDVVAKQLLDNLEAEFATPATTTTPLPLPEGEQLPLPEVQPTPAGDPANLPDLTLPQVPDNAETDLVGVWKAIAGDTIIQLTITEDSKFTWAATQNGNSLANISGDVAIGENDIQLSNSQQGNMEGSVKSLGENEWQFKVFGAPASDPGLKFERVKP